MKFNKTETYIINKIKTSRNGEYGFGSYSGIRVVRAINKLQRKGIITTVRHTIWTATYKPDTSILAKMA